MDSLNPQLFDFTLISPSGKVYNSSNTSYQQFPDTKQTIMLVDIPVDGDWQFLTEYTLSVALFTSATDHKPSGIVSQPETRSSRSNQISLAFNDYADTLHVQVLYDTDRKNFDGSFIDEFSMVNNATLTFDWQNESIPDGEYFIYTRIDDGKNTSELQYAPGSILVQNNPGIETPQNLATVQQGDSVIVSWAAPVQTNTVAATIYYKDRSTQRTEEESVTDTTKMALKNMAPGRGYETWCRFMNDAGAYSPKSNMLEFVFTSSSRNNPPYFTMDRDSALIFVAGNQGTYTLLASDADGNALTITVAGSGTEFSVNNGGNATLVAGQNIIMLPVLKVYSGGYLHAYITTNNQYCSLLKNNLVASGEYETREDEIPKTTMDGSFFRVYPNPTSGKITLVFSDDIGTSTVNIQIYNMF